MISTHRARQIEAASQALIARGGAFIDLPSLLPASLVLELAGEGLRPRLFFAISPDGQELCLRPDLTIPSVMSYIAQSEYDDEPFALACKGQVFRGPRNGEVRPPEFTQIGLERFGDKDIVETDVTVFVAAWSACQAAGLERPTTRFCDGGLLAHVIEKAVMPDVWRSALLEQTNHRRAFLNLLEVASGRAQGRPASPLEVELITLPFEGAKQRVAQTIADHDFALHGHRDVEDITKRLITRAKRAVADRLDAQICEALTALATFRHTDTLAQSLDAIVAIATSLSVDLTHWRANWDSRFNMIQSQKAGALKGAKFEAIGEEAFDYYDGMAFDIATSDDFSRPIASGGRYDRLVGEVSSGQRQARAIGCVIRPDRFNPDANGEA